MADLPDLTISSVPARITKPAGSRFQVYDANNNLVAHNDALETFDKDCLLDSFLRAGNGVDPAGAPFTVKFEYIGFAEPVGAQDQFPEGI